MKSYKLLGLSLLALTATSTAYATTLSYDHKYEDVAKEHTDELKINHDFASGLGAMIKMKFSPEDRESGAPGIAFHDNRWKETELGLSYAYDINEKLTIKPGFEWARKQDEYKYKPYIKLDYSLPFQLEISSRYRYEISDYAYKATKHLNRVDAGISRKFGKLEIGISETWYKSDAELYNNKKEDYEHAIEFKYKLAHKLSSFVQFSNESVNKHSDKRQTEFEIGVKYKI